MQMIRRFGAGLTEGSSADSALLGGKGANLCEMADLGLPVPPGFTITIEGFEAWKAAGSLPEALIDELSKAMAWLEQATERSFGGDSAPLLVSVRSGAAISMPGMLDSVLNIGLTSNAHAALIRETTARFAEDCRHRLIPALAAAALDLEAEEVEDASDDWLLENGVASDSMLDAAALAGANAAMMRWIEEEAGALPDDANAQLHAAICAVFQSWSGRRAQRYRALQGIDDGLGTAVTVQAMVFGNRRERSATGVAFTRDPSTGEARLYGEYLPNAQGEDVVAGIRTPAPLTIADASALACSQEPLETMLPEAFAELAAHAQTLESHFGDAQDIEFTVEHGKLWLLQTRRAKRSVRAAVRIAVEMAERDVISRDEALLRVPADSLEQLLHSKTDPSAPRLPIAKGLPASPGAATGEVVFTSAEAEAMKARNLPVILVRVETSPEDIHGMYAATGVLTVRGGMTSHAAVVARSLGKPCVCGATDARVDLEAGILYASDGREIRRGETLTIDGTSGEALLGAVPMIEPEPDAAFVTLMEWADARRRMSIRANADTAQEARIARRLGAQGIGLCRTEHAFFQPGRLPALQRLILAETADNRRAALAVLLPLQREDFTGILTEMQGLPVCIRLLDPPIHEFLPRTEGDIAALAEVMELKVETVRERADALREFNPMLGRRGCRIGVLLPEIYDMQIRAIFLAAVDVEIATGAAPDLEIMIPFISTEREMELMADRIDAMAAAIQHAQGRQPRYHTGVMIETPRAAIISHLICKRAEFISLGTNDLTQMVYGLSRDDVGRFVRDYVAKGAIPHDPFHRLDEEGVAPLLKMAVEGGKSTRPDLVTGLCGEHGGDPSTIRFCEKIGLDYVSCSPYRTPASRLAAAQARIEAERVT